MQMEVAYWIVYPLYPNEEDIIPSLSSPSFTEYVNKTKPVIFNWLEFLLVQRLQFDLNNIRLGYFFGILCSILLIRGQ